MDTFARNALRFTLAGAGIAVLATSYVSHASAAEPDGPDTAGPVVPSAQLLPTLPAPEYLLSPSSLDTFVLPTVGDLGLPGM